MRPQFVEESKVENLATHCNRRKLEVVKCASSDILIVARVADVRKRTGGRRPTARVNTNTPFTSSDAGISVPQLVTIVKCGLNLS